jgi:hypothetical protein
MWDYVMDKSGAGAGFLPELRFPLPIYIPSGSQQSFSLSPEASEQRLAQPTKEDNNNNNKIRYRIQ